MRESGNRWKWKSEVIWWKDGECRWKEQVSVSPSGSADCNLCPSVDPTAAAEPSLLDETCSAPALWGAKGSTSEPRQDTRSCSLCTPTTSVSAVHTGVSAANQRAASHPGPSASCSSGRALWEQRSSWGRRSKTGSRLPLTCSISGLVSPVDKVALPRTQKGVRHQRLEVYFSPDPELSGGRGLTSDWKPAQHRRSLWTDSPPVSVFPLCSLDPSAEQRSPSLRRPPGCSLPDPTPSAGRVWKPELRPELQHTPLLSLSYKAFTKIVNVFYSFQLPHGSSLWLLGDRVKNLVHVL